MLMKINNNKEGEKLTPNLLTAPLTFFFEDMNCNIRQTLDTNITFKCYIIFHTFPTVI